MNERIRELALRAGMRSPDLFKLTVSHMSTSQLEHFTKLIVEECMDCAEWVGQVNTMPVEPINTAQAIKMRMERHFGVLE